MGKIHCRITRRHGVSGSNQQIDCLRATICSPSNPGNRQLSEDATHASSINNIDMAGALEAVKTCLMRYLSNGETVHLDGIGSFQLSVGLKELTPTDAKVTARQIEIKGITFRPADSLINGLRQNVSFIIDEDRRDHATPDEALVLLREHFANCRQEQRAETITIRRFATLTASSYNTARRRVKQFVTDEYLRPSPDFKGHYLPGERL